MAFTVTLCLAGAEQVMAQRAWCGGSIVTLSRAGILLVDGASETTKTSTSAQAASWPTAAPILPIPAPREKPRTTMNMDKTIDLLQRLGEGDTANWATLNVLGGAVASGVGGTMGMIDLGGKITGKGVSSLISSLRDIDEKLLPGISRVGASNSETINFEQSKLF